MITYIGDTASHLKTSRTRRLNISGLVLH